MPRRKKLFASLAAVLATLLGSIGLTLVGQGDAQAHGVTMTPGSRTYLCMLDARTGTGALDPTNPACRAALDESGSTALYNWFAVLDSNAGGRGRVTSRTESCAAPVTGRRTTSPDTTPHVPTGPGHT